MTNNNLVALYKVDIVQLTDKGQFGSVVLWKEKIVHHCSKFFPNHKCSKALKYDCCEDGHLNYSATISVDVRIIIPVFHRYSNITKINICT
jgi:hypothetical protein